MSSLGWQYTAPESQTPAPEAAAPTTDFGSNAAAQEQLPTGSMWGIESPLLDEDEQIGIDPVGGPAETVPAEEAEAEAADGLDAIPNQDIIYEQLAHVYAYQGASAMDPQLQAWGYQIDPTLSVPHDEASGFGMMVFVPTEAALAERAAYEAHLGGSLRPVIAFRGSDLREGKVDKAEDVLLDWVENDLEEDGVGMPQFLEHEQRIRTAVGALGACDVTGHSLGGALAQLSACLIKGGISRIVTFQSPAIPADIAAQVPDDVDSTHYRVEGDIVSLAGEAMTDGEVVELDLGLGGDFVKAHTAMPLAEVADERDDPFLVGIDGTDAEIGDVERKDTDDVEQIGERVRQRLGDVIGWARTTALLILVPFVGQACAIALIYSLIALLIELVVALPQVAEELDWTKVEDALWPPLVELLVELDVNRDLAEQAAYGVLDAFWVFVQAMFAAEAADTAA